MIGTFFKLVGKAIRFSISRPLQRFNIANRAKKYIGEEAKYFTPAPRAIGALTLKGSTQYPHLQELSRFKSVKQRRLDAIAERNQKLLEKSSAAHSDGGSSEDSLTNTNQITTGGSNKSFSEIKQDDELVIETSNKLPAIRTVTIPNNTSVKQSSTDGEDVAKDTQLLEKPHRPMPTSTNLQLSDPALIWHVDKVPPGRLDLKKLQELMINKLADDEYWTPKKIAETYNIKEEYAENIVGYLRQIRIILSPRVAKTLDYIARNDPVYQATKNIIYHVDNSLRSQADKQSDKTFLPTDELEPEVRAVLDGGQLQPKSHQPDPRLTSLFKRPAPLRIRALNRPGDDDNDDGDSSDNVDKKPGLTGPKSSLPHSPPPPPTSPPTHANNNQ